MRERTSADENTAETNVVFELLSNARRRGVLYAIKRDGATTVEELAARVAAWQDDGHEPSHVHTSLVHSHLPKLDDANVVDYDRENGIVELADSEDLDPYLRATGESKPTLSSTDRRSQRAD